MQVIEQAMTSEQIAFLMQRYHHINRRFKKAGLYLAAGLVFIYKGPQIFNGAKPNLLIFKVYLLAFVLPAALIFGFVYLYFSPFKIKKDIKNGVKLAGKVTINRTEKMKEDLPELKHFDRVVYFEPNPFGLRKHMLSKLIEPELYDIKEYYVEVAKYSKRVLKMEPAGGK